MLLTHYLDLSGDGDSYLALVVCHRGQYRTRDGRVHGLSARLAYAVEETRLYPPDWEREPSAPQFETTTEVVMGTSFAVAQELAEDGPVCLLNFASATNPGGGFLRGSKAQEEDLCRGSGLFPCLVSPQAQPYYDRNRAVESILYTDNILYSPQVPFFRDDYGFFLEEGPFVASVITAPAPCLRDEHPFSTKEVVETIRNRVGKILAVAEANKVEVLILGAWGCGAFRNDSKVIAFAFREALDGPFKGVFRKVVFPIIPKDVKTHKVFSTLFGAQVREVEGS